MALSPDHERRIRGAAAHFADEIISVLGEQAPADDGIERLLDPKSAARLMGIGRSALYEAMARGDVRSCKIGKSRRIPASEISRLAACGLPDGG